MSDPTPQPAEAPATEPASEDPVALYGADAVSGKRFLRWNLGACVLGLIGAGIGLALTPSGAASAAKAEQFTVERVEAGVEVQTPAGTYRADHLRVRGDGRPWDVWVQGGQDPTLVRWQQGNRAGELAAPR